MILTNGDVLAIIIALISSITVICLFWRENILLRKEIKLLKDVIVNNELY